MHEWEKKEWDVLDVERNKLKKTSTANLNLVLALTDTQLKRAHRKPPLLDSMQSSIGNMYDV